MNYESWDETGIFFMDLSSYLMPPVGCLLKCRTQHPTREGENLQ
jgi:hypothetical protein